MNELGVGFSDDPKIISYIIIHIEFVLAICFVKIHITYNIYIISLIFTKDTNIYLERHWDETGVVTGERIRMFVTVLHLVMLLTVKYCLTTVPGCKDTLQMVHHDQQLNYN